MDAAVAEPLAGGEALDHRRRVVDAAVPASDDGMTHCTFPCCSLISLNVADGTDLAREGNLQTNFVHFMTNGMSYYIILNSRYKN